MDIRYEHLDEPFLNVESLDQSGESRRKDVLELVLIEQSNESSVGALRVHGHRRKSQKKNLMLSRNAPYLPRAQSSTGTWRRSLPCPDSIRRYLRNAVRKRAEHGTMLADPVRTACGKERDLILSLARRDRSECLAQKVRRRGTARDSSTYMTATILCISITHVILAFKLSQGRSASSLSRSLLHHESPDRSTPSIRHTFEHAPLKLAIFAPAASASRFSTFPPPIG